MCAYPKLIAAYHDLLRLLMPRHSPCALHSLIYFKLIFWRQGLKLSLSLTVCFELLSITFQLMTLLLNEIVLIQFCFTFILEYMQFSKNNREEK